MNFIKTSDAQSKQILLNLGFTLIGESNGISTFINNKKIVFNDKTIKATYTNILTF